MATPLADVFVQARLDTSHMSTDLRRATSSPTFTSAGTTAGKEVGGKFRSAFGSVLRNVGTGLVAYLGVREIAGFFKDSVSQASDLNETLNLTRVIFGQNSDAIVRWARSADQSLGLSENAALQARGQFANMFDQIGFGEQQTTRLSGRVVKLAADLGSFRNLGTEDVLERIQAGFRGEYDSLQLLVPTITAAAVQNRALKDTGLESADSLTAQQKAAATLEIIMGKSRNAVGDFARTSDGLANSQKILGAELDNAEAKLGKALLPTVTDFVHFLSDEGIPRLEDFADWFTEDGIPALQDMGDTVVDVADDVRPLFDAAVDLLRVLGDLPGGTKAFGAEALIASGLVFKMRGAMSGPWLPTYVDDADKARFNTQRLGQAFRMAAGVGGLLLFTRGLDESDDKLRTLETTAGGALFGSAFGPWGTVIGGATGLLTGLWTASDKVIDHFNDAEPEIVHYGNTFKGLEAKITGATRALSLQQLQTQPNLLRAADELGISMRTLIGYTLGLQKPTREIRQQVADLYKIIYARQAAGDPYAHLLNTVGILQNELPGLRGQFLDQQEATKGWAKILADIPHGVRTYLKLENFDLTKRQLDDLQETFPKLTDKQLRIVTRLINKDQVQKDLGDIALGIDDTRGSAERLGRTDPVLKVQADIRDATRTLDIFAGDVKPGRLLPGTPGAGSELFRLLGGVDVETENARRELSDFVNGTNTSLANIRDEPVRITLAAQARVENLLDRLGQVPGSAEGGPIQGGVPGKDSVLRLLMPDEHVWTADEVKKAGGHGVMYGLRRLARMGELPRRGDVGAMADGGAVIPDVSGDLGSVRAATGSIGGVVSRVASALSRRLSSAVLDYLKNATFGGQLGFAGRLTLDQMLHGQDFARSQVGKPYVWGGVGPDGYDCSGFQSAVLNAARGVNPYHRLGSTATMPWAGSAPGVGRYTIGWTTDAGGGIGHTSGNIGGLNVESYGGHGPAVGSGARSPLDPMFHGLMHYDTGGVLLPGTTVAHNGTGRPERVRTQQQERQLHQDLARIAREISRFSIGAKESAGEVHDEFASLIKEIRGTLGKDAPLIDRLSDIGARAVGLAHDREQTDKDLADAVSKLHSLTQASRQFSSGTRSSFTADPFNGQATTVRGLIALERSAVANVRRFLNAERKLIARGLDPALIRALIGNGPDAVEAAVALANAPDRLFRRFERLARTDRRLAGRVGSSAADELYGAGIKAAEGVVDGLRKERDRITRELDRIVEHVIRRVERALDDEGGRGHRHRGHGELVHIERLDAAGAEAGTAAAKALRAEMHKAATMLRR